MKIRCAALVVLTLLTVQGCGGSSAPDRTDVTRHYNSATDAFDQGDFAQANEHYTAAIEMPGLGPDQYVEACVRRAVSRAHLGDTAGAHADLDRLAQAPEVELVYSARAFVLATEGKRREAATMKAKARRLNRDVELFSK